MGSLKRAAVRAVSALFVFTTFALFAGSASADYPRPWELGMQAPASEVKDRINSFNDLLLVIIACIVVLVMALLLYVMVRFRASAHPVPTRTTHNTLIEVIWTVVPVLVLVLIAIPSFKLLYFEDRAPHAGMTLNVTAHQWYWSYGYPDNKVQFDSYMVQDKDLKPGQLRMLTADNPLVLPVHTDVRILVHGSDVMHSFFVTSLGVQIYAVPGRVNETWVNIDRPGTYYGECNQICGTNHAFMPIEVQALSKEDFQKWLETAKTKFAAVDTNDTVRVAAATPAAAQ